MSDDSEENDNNVSNYVVFHATTQKINESVTPIVVTDQTTATTSEVVASSDNSDSSENEDSKSGIDDIEGLNDEEILKAYEELLQKFIKVHTLNKSLKNKIYDLVDKNKSLEESVAKYKVFLKEKDERIRELTTEIDSTKRNLRMLNFGTTNLDQILNIGQSPKIQNGLGYSTVIDSVATEQKTVFVKAASTAAVQSVSGKKVISPVAESKVNRFVPICYFCNYPGHIRSKCCKYKKNLRMNKIEQSYFKPRTAPRTKIDLSDKPVKKLWIVKSHLTCQVAYTSMKAVTTDDWYFDNGCSRHITGEKRYLCDYQNMPDGCLFW